MMVSSEVKQYGGKIFPYSDLRAGTTLNEVIKKDKNYILRIEAWNFRSLKELSKSRPSIH